METVFCSFLRQQNVWKIYSINIYGRVSNFLIYDLKKSDSQMENIQIVKSFSRPKEVVANNSARWNSYKQQHEKLVAMQYW